MKLQSVWQEAWSRAQPRLPRLILTFGLLCLGVGAVMLLSRGWLSEKKFDLRGTATNSGGTVEMVVVDPQNLYAGETARFRVKVDTHQAQVVGLQLAVQVSGNAGVDNLDAKIIDGSGLQISYKDVRNITNGKELVVIALPNQIAGPYSTNGWRDWLEIELKPKQAGNLDFRVDQSHSKSLLYRSNPPQDILKPVDGWSRGVGGAGSPLTPTPTSTCPALPTNLTATRLSAEQIKLDWQDNDSVHTKYEIYLAELGEPPNGGRTLDKIADLEPASRSYTWEIAGRYRNRNYYRFLLKSIKSGCEISVRSNTISGSSAQVGTNLELTFRQQGVSRAGISIDAMISLKPKNQVNADWIFVFAPFTSDSDGLFVPNQLININQVEIQPNEPYLVAVKTQQSLNKILGEITIIPDGITTAPNAFARVPLRIGDFAHAGDSYNQIDIADIGLMLSQFTRLNISITDQFAQFDVNYDGFLNLTDVSLVLANYTDLIIKGDSV